MGLDESAAKGIRETLRTTSWGSGLQSRCLGLVGARVQVIAPINVFERQLVAPWRCIFLATRTNMVRQFFG
jgi:hypothetical protein